MENWGPRNTPMGRSSSAGSELDNHIRKPTYAGGEACGRSLTGVRHTYLRKLELLPLA